MSERQSEHVDAADALARAERLRRAVQRGSRWYVRYLVTFGVVWAGFVTGLSVLYAGRHRVSRRGYGRLHITWLAIWFALYCAVLIPGISWFHGELVWWLPGGFVVSLPCFVAAYWEHRR
ncbi:MAG: hypothetical protein GEV03_11830 [Streptosporangiales bacterium]|nr:hypothetical protein [Streptosporangiales bacterium]